MPKLKVDVNGELIPVSISENSEVLINKEIPEFFAVRNYITSHLDVLLKHWNKELTDRQVLNLLDKTNKS